MKILFIGHNTSYSGAPKSLLRIMTYLKKHRLADFDCLLRNGGPMTSEYKNVCEVYEFLPDAFIPRRSQPLSNIIRSLGLRLHRRRLLKTFQAKEYDIIYSNTVVNANVVDFLSPLRLPVIAHLREMHTAIEAYGGKGMIQLLDRFAVKYISVSETAKDVLHEYGVDKQKIEVIYNFLERSEIDCKPEVSARMIREQLSIPADAVVIGNVGTFNRRKGSDLFVETAALLADNDVHFIWVGSYDRNELEALLKDLTIEQRKRVHFPGEIPHPYVYYEVFDILLLTSRDDPFPLTAMEAAYFKKPVVCIAGTGGIPEVLKDPALVASEARAGLLKQTLTPLLGESSVRMALGERCYELFIRDLSIENQMRKIIKLIFDASKGVRNQVS